MENYKQDHLAYTVTSENKETVLEIIKHGDLHYWIYINGSLTDVMLPRNIAEDVIRDIRYSKNHLNLFNVLKFGNSMYNLKRIRNFLLI